MDSLRFDTYVAVFFPEADSAPVRYVTGVPSHNSAEWKAGQPAMKLSESFAKDIVFGLTMNGYLAAVVKFLHGVELHNCDKY